MPSTTGNSLLPVSFLIDSDADVSFIDEELAKQAGLPLVELAEPWMVFDLNGRALTRVTHCTAPLTGFG